MKKSFIIALVATILTLVGCAQRQAGSPLSFQKTQAFEQLHTKEHCKPGLPVSRLRIPNEDQSAIITSFILCVPIHGDKVVILTCDHQMSECTAQRGQRSAEELEKILSRPAHLKDI